MCYMYYGNPIIDLSSAILPGEEVKLITPYEFDVKPYMYAVTSFGRVLCIKDARFGGAIKEKKPFVNKDGYYSVTLQGILRYTTKIRLNRLVATYFIPNPENKPEVDHIDNDRSNNAASNLQWATHIEHMSKIADRCMNNEKAIAIKEDMENNPDMSVSELARRNGVSRTYIDRLKYGLPYSEINNTRKRENCYV